MSQCQQSADDRHRTCLLDLLSSLVKHGLQRTFDDLARFWPHDLENIDLLPEISYLDFTEVRRRRRVFDDLQSEGSSDLKFNIHLRVDGRMDPDPRSSSHTRACLGLLGLVSHERQLLNLLTAILCCRCNIRLRYRTPQNGDRGNKSKRICAPSIQVRVACSCTSNKSKYISVQAR